jgi:hypothetical protein
MALMSFPRSSARLNRVTSVIRLGVTGVGVLLVGFHAVLFADQIARGALADPGLALRWVAAAGLAAAILELRRRGASLLGRQAVAVWVLAALLHGPALTASATNADAPALPEAIVTVLQIVVAGTGVGLLLVSALALRRLARPVSVRFCLPRRRPISAEFVGLPPSFAPRPPPCA